MTMTDKIVSFVRDVEISGLGFGVCDIPIG
jgi:hypothetical protein